MKSTRTFDYENTWRGSHSNEYSDLIRQRMMERVTKGGVARFAPLGFINEWHNYRSSVRVDVHSAPLVREVFNLALVGKSSREIMLLMNEKGMKSKRGLPMSPSSIYALLTNPFYAGFIRLNGSLYKGIHEPLVSIEEFNKVQERFGRVLLEPNNLK